MTPSTNGRDNQALCCLFRSKLRHVCLRLVNWRFLPHEIQNITGCSHRSPCYKWFPTSQVVLKEFQLSIVFSNLCGNSNNQARRSRKHFIKTLGFVGKPNSEDCTFKVNSSEGSSQTKQQFSSKISHILDTLGPRYSIVNQLK